MPFGFRCSNDLYIYSPKNENTLIKINTNGNMPEKTYGQAIIYHNNYLYIIGGTNGYYFSCDIQRYYMTVFIVNIICKFFAIISKMIIN